MTGALELLRDSLTERDRLLRELRTRQAELEVAKQEAGRMQALIEPFDVSALVKDVRTLIEPMVARNSNTLRITIEPTIERMSSDVVKVKQTLINLLSNATKFTDHGIIDLDVRTILESGVE